MTINIQVIGDRISNAARQRIRRRMIKLSTFNERIIAVNAVLKKDNLSKDKGFHCEIRVIIKGYDLFGKSKAPGFEEAASMAIESLRRRLLKKNTVYVKERRKNKFVLHGV